MRRMVLVVVVCLLVASQCAAQSDWTVGVGDIEADVNSHGTTDVLLFGQSQDLESEEGTVAPFGYVNSTAQPISYIDADNASGLTISAAAVADEKDTTYVVSASMVRIHNGTTDLPGAEAMAESYSDAYGEIFATANKTGLVRGTIKINPPQGIALFEGPEPQFIDDQMLYAVAGNSVYVYTFDASNSEWTRTGWENRYNHNSQQNERFEVGIQKYQGFRSIFDHEYEIYEMVQEETPYQIRAGHNDQFGYWISPIISWLTGSGTKSKDTLSVSVSINKEIEDLP